jgi:hypothetical protein
MLLMVILSSLALGQVSRSDNFPDIPDNHWAYEAFEHLRKQQLLLGVPHVHLTTNPWSRIEVAKMISATCNGLKNSVPRVEQSWFKDARSHLLYERVSVSALPKLLNEFSTELKKVGPSPKVLNLEVKVALVSINAALKRHPGK